MKAVIEYLGGISSSFAFIIGFLSDLVADLAYVGQLFSGLWDSLPVYLSWLPAGALVIFILCYHVVGVFRLLKM